MIRDRFGRLVWNEKKTEGLYRKEESLVVAQLFGVRDHLHGDGEAMAKPRELSLSLSLSHPNPPAQLCAAWETVPNDENALDGRCRILIGDYRECGPRAMILLDMVGHFELCI